MSDVQTTPTAGPIGGSQVCLMDLRTARGNNTTLKRSDTIEIERKTLIMRIKRNGKPLYFVTERGHQKEEFILDFMAKGIAPNGLVALISALTNLNFQTVHRTRTQDVLQWTVE